MIMNSEYLNALMNKATSDQVPCYNFIKMLPDDKILVSSLHPSRFNVDSQFLICTNFSSLPLREKNVHESKCGSQNVKRGTTSKLINVLEASVTSQTDYGGNLDVTSKQILMINGIVTLLYCMKIYFTVEENMNYIFNSLLDMQIVEKCGVTVKESTAIKPSASVYSQVSYMIKLTKIQGKIKVRETVELVKHANCDVSNKRGLLRTGLSKCKLWAI